MNRKKSVWETREADLATVKRFNDPVRPYKIMYYRTDLSVHTKRVVAINREVCTVAVECYSEFKAQRSLYMSEHHDDHEVILKDASAHAKGEMNKKQLELFEHKEVAAIRRLGRKYPNQIEGYSYEDIMIEAFHKDTRESQSHSYSDKVDAYCESIHEVLAGNTVFIDSALWYVWKYFTQREEKFPLIFELFKDPYASKSKFLQFPAPDTIGFFNHGLQCARPHTEETIMQKTGIPIYEAWKDITLRNFPNGMDLLINQTEFHK